MASNLRGWSVVPPLLLKLAPELEGAELEEVLSSVEKWGVDGFILTNTLGGNWSSPALQGGWSGAVLTEKSRASLRTARKATRKPIISVGGIDSEEEALLRLREGADLIQIYSGWVFEGPTFPGRLSQAILEGVRR